MSHPTPYLLKASGDDVAHKAPLHDAGDSFGAKRRGFFHGEQLAQDPQVHGNGRLAPIVQKAGTDKHALQ